VHQDKEQVLTTFRFLAALVSIDDRGIEVGEGRGEDVRRKGDEN
jgi:hypothetical protein